MHFIIKCIIAVLLANVCLQAHAGVSDFPIISNKRIINVVLEKGHWTEYVKKNLAPEFTKQTGVKVNIIELKLADMLEVQVESFVNASAKYDVVTLEAGWAKEWAAKGYTRPLNTLANKFDSTKKIGIIFLLHFSLHL